MVGWHHWPNGHEFEQASGDGEGQGSLACCSPMGLQSPTRLSDWINKKMFLYLCFPSLFLFQCHNIFLLSFPFALHSPLFPLPPFLPPSPFLSFSFFLSNLPFLFTCLMRSGDNLIRDCLLWEYPPWGMSAKADWACLPGWCWSHRNSFTCLLFSNLCQAERG